MPESQQHRRLVQHLHDWVMSTHIHDSPTVVYIDSRQYSHISRPPLVNGYIPDLYVSRPDDSGVIIGEAKTANDLENEHTHSQFIAYLSWCAAREGSLLVVAVPWYMSRFAKSMVHNIEKRLRVRPDSIVLDELDPTTIP